MRWLDGITDLMHIEFELTPGDGDGQGGLGMLRLMGSQRVRQD